MRASGETVGSEGFGVHDHVCWAFDGVDDLMPAVLDFLAEGLKLGLRVEFVADAAVGDLRRLLQPLGDVGALTAAGALRVTSLSSVYSPVGATSDPDDQVRTYASATRAAVRDGFAGYRVAADATTLVRSAAHRRSFARYEHLVDHAMVTEPFSALCCYDRTVLGPGAVAELACLHPVTRSGAAPFALFHGEDGLAVRGEMDTFDTALLRQALACAMPLTGGQHVEVDAADVRFVDHHALLTLEEHGRAANATIVLRNAGASFARLQALLELQAVQIGGPV